MPRKKQTFPMTYAGGIIRHEPERTSPFRAVVERNGKRSRKSHKMLADAKAWITDTMVVLASGHAPLSSHDQSDAQRAREMLPSDVTFLEVAQYYLRHHGGKHAGITMNDAVERFIDDKERANMKFRAIKSLRNRIRYAARDLGEHALAEVDVDMLLAWMAGQEWAPETRKNYRRVLHNFFGWCVRAQMITANPVTAITAPKTDHKEPGILSVEQAACLMRTAEENDPDLCMQFATGLFAGVRRAELDGLDQGSIQEEIHIGADIAKTRGTRGQRYVTISNNLKAWYDRYQTTGPVNVLNNRRRTDRVIKAAGIVPWPQNAFRHSFASYHLALHRNAPLTSHEIGHTNPDTLFKHYRNLVTASDAGKFFEIRPRNA